jgi:hypothetical protein
MLLISLLIFIFLVVLPFKVFCDEIVNDYNEKK